MLRWRQVGEDRPGAPLLCIHGAGGSSAVWLPLMHRLARHRRVAAVDLPGHGQSPGRAESVEELRDAVGEAAAHLGLGRSVLVGHSMGGVVALDAALAWPDKVAGLVLVTTGARLRVGAETFAAIREAWPRWPARFAEMGFSAETPSDVREQAAAVYCSAPQEVTLADFRAADAYDARARLASISTPTLVVAGADDLFTPPKWSRWLAEGIPGARLVTLARCGHALMIEQPDALAAEILALVARTL